MDPMTIGLLAGGGLGLGKGMLEQQQAARDRKMEGAIAQWSPWTGMQAGRVKDPSMIGSVLSGGLTGAMMGQAMGGGAGAAGGSGSTDAGTSLAPATEGAGNSAGAANMSVGQPSYSYGSYGQQQPPWMSMPVASR